MSMSIPGIIVTLTCLPVLFILSLNSLTQNNCLSLDLKNW